MPVHTWNKKPMILYSLFHSFEPESLFEPLNLELGSLPASLLHPSILACLSSGIASTWRHIVTRMLRIRIQVLIIAQQELYLTDPFPSLYDVCLFVFIAVLFYSFIFSEEFLRKFR